MKLDIFTLTVVGMLLCGVIAALQALTLGRLPASERRSLKVWTVGLTLQPLAWTLFSIRGNTPDVPLSVIANLLLILGFAELARAVRIFLGYPERRLTLYAIAIACALAIGFAAAFSKNFSALVMLNALGVSLTLLMMLWPLLSRLRGGGPPMLMLVSFSILGMLILGARFIEHLLRPQINGGFLLPSLADTVAVTYAAFGPVIVNFGFVLMHQERAYAALQRVATTDGLTGLLNRRAFEEAANARLALADQDRQDLALLLLDLDHFKRVNDEHGHANGDRALQLAAAHLQQALAPGELAARMGGEELALLIVADPEAAERRAEALRCRFAEHPLRLADSSSVPVQTSIGLASRMPGGLDLDQLLRAADVALYAAKSGGRNRVSLANTAAPRRPA